ncbi:hypothetical protein [Oceanicola sp. 502str15]|nr:hypothetical protein [Oceanicola sp. 502str15]
MIISTNSFVEGQQVGGRKAIATGWAIGTEPTGAAPGTVFGPESA